MYQDVLGAATATTTATIILPNTGSSVMLEVATMATILVGCSVLLSSLVRMVISKL